MKSYKNFTKKRAKTEDNTSGFVTNLFKGIGNILSSAIQMEKDGISEHFLISQIEGKTKKWQKIKKFNRLFGLESDWIILLIA